MTQPIHRIGLSPDLFAAAFPFHFAFDRNLQVRQVGQSLARLYPALEPGVCILDALRIVYPTGADSFETIARFATHLFVLELKDHDVRLRGQMVHAVQEDLMIFLGSPWVTAPGEVRRLGLTLNDFALHDPVADLLQVMQSQAMVLADTRRLADRLSAQRAELTAANSALRAEIAERVAVEVALREREDRFHTLIESASEAILITDEEGRIVLVNERTETLFGYNRVELVGEFVEMLLPPAYHGNHRRHRAGFMQHPHTRPMGGGLTLAGRRKDGVELPLEISLSTISTRNGSLIMAFITDVTERRRAAEELQSERDFALQVMGAMGQGLAVSDARGRFEYVNPAFARMLGHTPEATIGHTMMDFTAPSERDRFARSHSLLRAGRTLNEEAVLYDAAGHEVHVLLTCVPRLRHNTFLGVITVVTDLAERKQIERTMEWARDRAIEASRLKSDFLANMSHEIRTPLTSIIGLSEMLSATPLEETQREYANIILESGKALLALIDDILDFSKIEAGKMVIEQRPLELRHCIESALDVVAPRAIQKGLDLAYLLEESAPQRILGDATRLQQILINLLGNAVKFTEHGEVTLTVRAASLQRSAQARAEHEADFDLHFAVQDSGIGIPLERQERLFQSFSQVDASTTRRYGGTGLGLAISRRLCEAMGGRMWVESAGIAGQGTTFHFTLPVKAAPLPALAADAPTEQPGDTHALSAGNGAAYNSRAPISRAPISSAPISSAPISRAIVDVLHDKQVIFVLGNHGAAIQWRSLALQAQAVGVQVYFCTSLDEAIEWQTLGKHIDAAVIDSRLVEHGGPRVAQQMSGALDSVAWLVLAPLGHQPATGLPPRATTVHTPVKSGHWLQALANALAPKLASQPQPAGNDRFDPTLAGRVPLRILVVEDNQVNQIVVRRLLERFGYHADAAVSGPSALAHVQRQDYDLILMDMHMPEMDGLETTRAIRTFENRAPEGTHCTIVAFTANALEADRAACLDAGMNSYLSKPIQVDELRRVLETCPRRLVNA